MNLSNLAAMAWRAVLRETVGRRIRDDAARSPGRLRKAQELTSLYCYNAEHLQPEDVRAAAPTWGLEPAILHAFVDFATIGPGFDDQKRPTIVVEPDQFSAATWHAFDRTHPYLSYPVWQPYMPDRTPPGMFPDHPYTLTFNARWLLFQQMAELHPHGALCALKAGRFQTRVRRWKLLGFDSPEILLRFLARSEREQLEVLRREMVAEGLQGPLAAFDWRTVARICRGPLKVDEDAAFLAGRFKVRARSYQ
jgi:hypothetical protein